MRGGKPLVRSGRLITNIFNYMIFNIFILDKNDFIQPNGKDNIASR